MVIIAVFSLRLRTTSPHHHGGPAGEEGQDEAAAAVERRAEDGAERVARAERGVHQRVHPARAAGEAAGENILEAQKIFVRYATSRGAARAWRSRAWPRPPPPAAAACRPSPGSSPTTDQLLLELSSNVRSISYLLTLSCMNVRRPKVRAAMLTSPSPARNTRERPHLGHVL